MPLPRRRDVRRVFRRRRVYLLAHQLAPIADGDGEGDGGAPVREAGVEDGDDAPVVVEDRAAGVARTRRVDLQLVRVADDADRGLLGPAAPLGAPVDATDVADRDGRVGYLYGVRLGVDGVLRLDDAVDGRGDGRVAEHHSRLARLYRVVVVVDLDRGHCAGAVNLDERNIVTRADGGELRRQSSLRVREEHVEVVVATVVGDVVLLRLRGNPVGRGLRDDGEDGGLAVGAGAEQYASVGGGRELVGRLPGRRDVAVRQDEAVGGDREAGARVATADADVQRVGVVSQVRLDGAVGDAHVACARLAVDHHVLMVDQPVALLLGELPGAVNLDDRAAVVLHDVGGLH